MGDWTDEIELEERVYPPVHPGEVLREEWLVPLDINANQLAGALGVDCQKVYDIVNGKRGVSAEMALRLARWSGTRPRFWLGLQEQYDLAIVQMEAEKRIVNEVRPLATSSTPRTPQDPR
jgi:antitoxin HigA-1